MKKQIVLAGASIVACTTFGAGFQVLEQGAANLGSALAGATANASGDTSSAFWNPSASIFSDIKTGEIRADGGLNFIMPTFDFDDEGSSPVGGGNGGNAGEIAYVPNFFSAYKFDDRWALTFSMTSTYGLETDYDDGWVGRFHALNSKLTTFDISPSLVFKAADWLSFSAGAAANWIHADLSQAAIFGGNEGTIRFSGDSWSAGAVLGATVEYMEGGRIGVSWRSSISQDVRGNSHINGAVYKPIQCELVLPQTVNIGWYQRLWGRMHRFAVMADYAWTGWSCFDKLDIKYAETGASIAPVIENWKDTSRVALGFNYHPAFEDKMVFRWGAAWDESPIRSPKYRTARIPCSDRFWLSCGAGYRYENITINLSYMYIFFYNDSQIENTSPSGAGTLKGVYTGHAQVISLQAGISF